MSNGTLNVSVFIGAHHELQQFRTAYPILTEQLLGGDMCAIDVAIISNAVIPADIDLEVRSEKPNSREEYEKSISSFILAALRKGYQSGIEVKNQEALGKNYQKTPDLINMAGRITKTIMGNHKNPLSSNIISQASREYPIHASGYINEGNELMLSFTGMFEVAEKNSTRLGTSGTTQIKGTIEINFLYLNVELLGDLEDGVAKTPLAEREKKTIEIFKNYCLQHEKMEVDDLPEVPEKTHYCGAGPEINSTPKKPERRGSMLTANWLPKIFPERKDSKSYDTRRPQQEQREQHEEVIVQTLKVEIPDGNQPLEGDMKARSNWLPKVFPERKDTKSYDTRQSQQEQREQHEEVIVQTPKVEIPDGNQPPEGDTKARSNAPHAIIQEGTVNQ